MPAIPHAGLAGVPLLTLPDDDVPAGVPSSTTLVAVAGTVPVPTVLCVVLGILLCLALGTLAVQACRARAWCRGGSRWVGAGAELVWGSWGFPAARQLRGWAAGDPSATHGPHGPG